MQGSKPTYLWVPLQSSGKRGVKARLKRLLLRRPRRAFYDPHGPTLKVQQPQQLRQGNHTLSLRLRLLPSAWQSCHQGQASHVE